MDWFLSLHFSHQFKLFCHLTCETIWSWVWSKLCLEKLDLIVVEIFLWFFITWSSLLLIIHIHFNLVFWHLIYHLVIFVLIISSLWLGTICFFVSRAISILLRLIDSCSSFMCHVYVKFSTFPRGDLFLSLCVSWGRAPTCLKFPRRLPLSRCRAGEWPDDKFMYILGAPISLQYCTHGTSISGKQYLSSIFYRITWYPTMLYMVVFHDQNTFLSQKATH